MVIKDIAFTLKDGRSAVLRSPKYEDIPSTLDYLHTTASETEFLLRYPEECAKYSAEGEKSVFDRANTADNIAMIMCVVDGRIAGSCEISWSNNIKTRHRASIAIALVKDYWNQGIGSMMFKEMMRIAESNENILQIELDFVEGNTRARALYEKMGFRIVGVRPNAIRLKDGTLLNEYSMLLEIRR